MKVLLVGIQTYRGYPFLSLYNLQSYAKGGEGVRVKSDIRVLEYHYRGGGDDEEILNALKDQGADVIGFTCYVWNMSGVESIGRELRRRDDRVKIVLGGPNVYDESCGPERYLDWADVVVRGEGEITFSELVRAWEDGAPLSGVEGITFREGEEVQSTEDRALLGELDRIPSPYLSGMIDLEKVETTNNYVEVSRGCPFSCSYCKRPNLQQRARLFSLERIEAEMDHILRKRGKGMLVLSDADPFMRTDRTKRLLMNFYRLSEGKNALLSFNGDVMHLKDDLIEPLNSPQIVIALGIQSTDPQVLAGANRQFDATRARATALKLREKAPLAKIILHVIIGLPRDDWKSFRSTVEWCLSVNPHHIILFRTLVLPGTELWLKSREYGLEYNPEQMNLLVSTPTLSNEELNAAHELVTRINALRTVPLIRDFFWRYGHSLSGSAEAPFVTAAERFIEWVTDQDEYLRERLDMKNSVDWSRRGLYWDNEFMLAKEDRLALLESLGEYLEIISPEFPSDGDWGGRIRTAMERYEWLDHLEGYLKQALKTEGDRKNGVLVGRDIVGVIEGLNGAGWRLHGVDVTERACQSIQQLTLSAEWDRIRVASYDSLSQAPWKGFQKLVFERMWGTLCQDARLEDKMNHLDRYAEPRAMIMFLERDGDDLTGNGRLEHVLKGLGYLEAGRMEVGSLSGIPVFARCWQRDH